MPAVLLGVGGFLLLVTLTAVTIGICKKPRKRLLCECVSAAGTEATQHAGWLVCCPPTRLTIGVSCRAAAARSGSGEAKDSESPDYEDVWSQAGGCAHRGEC